MESLLLIGLKSLYRKLFPLPADFERHGLSWPEIKGGYGASFRKAEQKSLWICEALIVLSWIVLWRLNDMANSARLPDTVLVVNENADLVVAILTGTIGILLMRCFIAHRLVGELGPIYGRYRDYKEGYRSGIGRALACLASLSIAFWTAASILDTRTQFGAGGITIHKFGSPGPKHYSWKEVDKVVHAKGWRNQSGNRKASSDIWQIRFTDGTKWQWRQPKLQELMPEVMGYVSKMSGRPLAEYYELPWYEISEN